MSIERAPDQANVSNFPHLILNAHNTRKCDRFTGVKVLGWVAIGLIAGWLCGCGGPELTEEQKDRAYVESLSEPSVPHTREISSF